MQSSRPKPGTTYWSHVGPAGDGLPSGPVYRTPWAMVSAFRADPVAYFEAIFRAFGDVAALRAWPITSFFLCHPDHIKHVLKENNRGYVKGIAISRPTPCVSARVSRICRSAAGRACASGTSSRSWKRSSSWRRRSSAIGYAARPRARWSCRTMQLTFRPKGGLPMRVLEV